VYSATDVFFLHDFDAADFSIDGVVSVFHVLTDWKLVFVCQLKHCVDKLSKSTYLSLAPITVFVISGLQSVIY